MKNKITTAIICFLLLFNCSCQKKQQEAFLISGFKQSVKEVKSLDELFGKKGKQTALETTDEVLVGKIGKIIKRKGYFSYSPKKEKYFNLMITADLFQL